MGGGKGDRESARELAKSQADIGKELVGLSKGLWKESAPYRKQTADYWSNVIKGGPGLTRLVSPQLNQATRQFGLARRQAKEMAPGGVRDSTLGNLRIAEAGAKTNIMSGGVADALQRLANQANFGTQTGLSGIGGGGSQIGQAGGQYFNLAQLGAQSAGGIGSGIGSLVGMI
jgi:hypothetical protein